MRILFLGDVFGQPGRDAVVRELPGLAAEVAADFVVANGENVANGAGITSKLAQKLLSAGVDVITTGNHVWRQREVFPFLDASDRIVRPANFPPSSPGRGLTVQTASSGDEVVVINLMGQVFIGTGISPFRIVDALGRRGSDHGRDDRRRPARRGDQREGRDGELPGRPRHRRLGTHTHVQTADEHVTAKGTAAITDVGMCGPRDSVIGVRTDIILRRFLTELPAQFEVADGDVRIDALLVTAEGGRATAVERLERRC